MMFREIDILQRRQDFDRVKICYEREIECKIFEERPLAREGALHWEVLGMLCGIM